MLVSENVFLYSSPSTVKQMQRNMLPIAHYREEIIEQLERSQVLVLSGETGWWVALTLK